MDSCFSHVKNFAMDALANCVFGITSDMQNNEKNSFFVHANKFLESGLGYDPVVILMRIFKYLFFIKNINYLINN